MVNLKLISLNGLNYFFKNGHLYGLENEVFFKINDLGIKIPVYYGGVSIPLHDGKNLVFTNKSFYIKE